MTTLRRVCAKLMTVDTRIRDDYWKRDIIPRWRIMADDDPDGAIRHSDDDPILFQACVVGSDGIEIRHCWWW